MTANQVLLDYLPGSHTLPDYFVEVKSMRHRLNGVGLKFQFMTTEKHRLFIEGANKLIIEPNSAKTIEDFDKVFITDTYLIGYKYTGVSGFPEVTLFSVVKYIAAAISDFDTFEIAPQDLKLNSVIKLGAKLELVQADLMQKALFLYFREGGTSVLFRICTTTYRVSQINFNGLTGQFPEVSAVQYLEYMGVITISYRLRGGDKQIWTIRSAPSVNTLEGMSHTNTSSCGLCSAVLNTSTFQNVTFSLSPWHIDGTALISVLMRNTSNDSTVMYHQRDTNMSLSRLS